MYVPWTVAEGLLGAALVVGSLVCAEVLVGVAALAMPMSEVFVGVACGCVETVPVAECEDDVVALCCLELSPPVLNRTNEAITNVTVVKFRYCELTTRSAAGTLSVLAAVGTVTTMTVLYVSADNAVELPWCTGKV